MCPPGVKGGEEASERLAAVGFKLGIALDGLAVGREQRTDLPSVVMAQPVGCRLFQGLERQVAHFPRMLRLDGPEKVLPGLVNLVRLISRGSLSVQGKTRLRNQQEIVR